MEKILLLAALLLSGLMPEAAKKSLLTHTTNIECEITSLAFDEIGECDNNGTSDPDDDFFTANVVAEFANPPATGQFQIDLGEDAILGGGVVSVDVEDLDPSGIHIFQGVRFKANNDPTEVRVLFSDLPGCTLLNTDGPTVAPCSDPSQCSIDVVSFSNASPCNNNGTGIATDDFFTMNVTVTFSNPPISGDLRIEPGGDALPGGGATTVPVASLSGNSHVFTGVRFKADGTPTVVEVEFTANSGCVRTASTSAVSSCSGALACDIISASVTGAGSCNDNGTTDTNDDFFAANVNVSFSNPPATGDLRIEPGGDALPGGGATSIPVANLVGTSHTFSGVRFKADGTVTVVEVEFSADNACVITTTGPTVQPCSSTSPPCEITVNFSGSAGGCDDNGTPNDPNDDFFTHNIFASFFNRPLTGSLQIVPGGDVIGTYSIPVANIIGNSHIFNGVKFKADGATSVVTMNFTDDPGCSDSANGPAVQPCSTPPPPCEITVNFSGSAGGCDDNGTPNDPSDDFFTHNIFASFFNRPLTGSLQIVPGGDVIGTYSIPVANIIGNSHIFNGVKFKADGATSVVTMNFTDDPGCSDSANGPAVGPCCDLAITNVVATPESCPNANNGSITVLATTSAGPITYAISGPVNQSNNTGVFTGLPDGNYTIAVTDNGVANCSKNASAVVAAGTDNTTPLPVCRTTTVTLDATGNYTLTAADVFNQGASTDNCGTVNFVNLSPTAVGCAQAGQTVPVTVQVNDGNGNTASCTAQVNVQEGTALPPGFSGANVGNANGSGIFQPCSGQQFTVSSVGFSTSAADVQHLVSRQLCGSGEITARIAGVSGGGWAGVILRETTAVGSKKVALKTQLTNNIHREIRTTTNGAVNNLNFFRPQDTWLRLVRSGNIFSGYTSQDGINWNFAFSATISMSNCIRAGIFAEGINVNTATTAVFDHVSVTGAAALVAPNIGEGTVGATATADFQVYPNPATGEVNLDLSAFANRAIQLDVCLSDGRTVKTYAYDVMDKTTERLDLSALQNGVYFIRIKSAGWPDVTRQIILQRD